MHFNIIRLRRAVLAGLLIAIVSAALIVAASYYFYFRLVDREAGLLGGAAEFTWLRELSAEESSGWVAERLDKKRSLPVIRPQDVADVFDPARVPVRD